MSDYRLARDGEWWRVIDADGVCHGRQPTRPLARQLLKILQHMDLARIGFQTEIR